jgi:hypothetical protein
VNQSQGRIEGLPFLEQRIEELRQRFIQTGEAEWIHRYNEAKYINERLIVDRVSRGSQSVQGDEP